MEDNIAIKVSHVSKTFRIPYEKVSSLRVAAVSLPAMLRIALQAGAFKGNRGYPGRNVTHSAAGGEEFKVYPVASATGALDDVSFEACPKRFEYRSGRVKKGEFFACLSGRQACLPARQGIIGRNGSSKSTIQMGVDRIFRCAIIDLLKPPALTPQKARRVFV